MTAPLPPLLLRGDCLVELARIPDNSVDSIVTDPPYGLEFMGKQWDSFSTGRGKKYAAGGSLDVDGMKAQSGKGGAGPSYVNRPAKRCAKCGKQAWSGSPCVCEAPVWKIDNSPLESFERFTEAWASECYRILKPGGHMLAFGGSRTWHRLAAGIEDAGFEIRDSIAWLYGSGFPKSMDVSKAIDKQRDDYPAIREVVMYLRAAVEASSIERSALDEALGGPAVMSHFLAPSRSNAGCPTWEQWGVLKVLLALGDDMDAEVWRLNGRKGKPGEAWEQREVIGESAHKSGIGNGVKGHYTVGGTKAETVTLTAPATDAAREWEGWGTALKPAFEPIVVGRKPLGEKTVAANVLAHGTGALNIDASRIDAKGAKLDGGAAGGSVKFAHEGWNRPWMEDAAAVDAHAERIRGNVAKAESLGRWPANVVLDESQAAALDEQAPKTGAAARASGPTRTGRHESNSRAGAFNGTPDEAPLYGTELGGASRFFYVAKAPKSERPVVDGTAHPTVKPLALMRWLIRLVTPPGGCVVDPFAGSGTTLEAAYLEGFESIGVELTADYWPLIEARIARVTA